MMRPRPLPTLAMVKSPTAHAVLRNFYGCRPHRSKWRNG